MLSAEEKNATMSAERAFLAELLETSLKGDFAKLKTLVNKYVIEHKNKDKDGMTVGQVLTQFKDGNRRTVLHFACQSLASASDDGKMLTAEEDIISSNKLLKCSNDWISSQDTLQSLIRLKDKDGLTPIMLAAQHNNQLLGQKRVLALLDAAASAAAANGQSTTTKNLSKLGLARSKTGATALHYASGSGASPETIRALYNNGQIAIKTFSQKGGAPLHWACAISPPHDYTSTIQTLTIDCNADINGNITSQQQTAPSASSPPPPLLMSIAAGNDAHAKCLIDIASKKNLDIWPSINYILPGDVNVFHMLADMNLVGSLAALLDWCNANNKEDKNDYNKLLNTKNHEGYIPLDLAAKEEHVGCVLLLLPNSKDGDGSGTEQDAKECIEKLKNKLKNSPVTDSKEVPKSKVPEDANPVPPKDSASDADPIENKAIQDVANILSNKDTKTIDKEKAKELKAIGNSHFGKKEYKDAIEYYTKAIDMDPTDETFYSNRSACYIMMVSNNKNNTNDTDNEYKNNALYDAVVARTLKPNWSKACYRMAVARLELGRYEDAALSAWEGLQQDQDNDELKSLLQKCVKKGRKEHQQQQKGKSRTDDNGEDHPELKEE